MEMTLADVCQRLNSLLDLGRGLLYTLWVVFGLQVFRAIVQGKNSRHLWAVLLLGGAGAWADWELGPSGTVTRGTSPYTHIWIDWEDVYRDANGTIQQDRLASCVGELVVYIAPCESGVNGLYGWFNLGPACWGTPLPTISSVKQMIVQQGHQPWDLDDAKSIGVTAAARRRDAVATGVWNKVGTLISRNVHYRNPVGCAVNPNWNSELAAPPGTIPDGWLTPPPVRWDTDQDGDGWNDRLEQILGKNYEDPNDKPTWADWDRMAGKDTDGDGYSDLREEIDGSDLFNSLSHGFDSTQENYNPVGTPVINGSDWADVDGDGTSDTVEFWSGNNPISGNPSPTLPGPKLAGSPSTGRNPVPGDAGEGEGLGEIPEGGGLVDGGSSGSSSGSGYSPGAGSAEVDLTPLDSPKLDSLDVAPIEVGEKLRAPNLPTIGVTNIRKPFGLTLRGITLRGEWSSMPGSWLGSAGQALEWARVVFRALTVVLVWWLFFRGVLRCII